MKPLYVSATKQDTGKTTILLGLLQALRDAGHDVGYMKPVGQRYVQYQGLNVDEDAVLARQTFELGDNPGDMSPIAIERGFTEHYIFHRDPLPLEWRMMEAFDRLRAAHEILLVEGTGHAGVGSCFDLSNARAADLLNAPVLILTSGGIGRAIDEAALSYHLFRKHDVEVLGVILNKVWPEKQAKVERAVGEGLKHLGTRLLGVVPYRSALVFPRLEQIADEANGRVLCGTEEQLDNIVEHTVVAAMSPQNVCAYIRPRTLVVTPGDRIDNILISTITCPTETPNAGPISGLVLTGGFEPPASIIALLRAAEIPVLLCQEDTYTVASRLRELRFKIRPEDTDKIEAAKLLVRHSVEIEAITTALAEES